MIKLFYQTILFAVGLGFVYGCSGITENSRSPMTDRESQQPVLPTYTPNATQTPYPTLEPAIVKPEISEKEGDEYWQTEPLGREFYAYVDVKTEPLIPIQEFNSVYIEALERGETWIKNPIIVALRFAGYPNLDETYPNQLFVFQESDNHVIVVVRAFNLMDDSIKDTEKRIELVRENGTWKIEWAGFRQRCYRSSFEGWTTDLCP